jgi:tRNA(Ile)-lysidine synthase
LLSQFSQYFKQREPNAHYLAAVSGGVDSVVLCHLCHESGLRFTIAHCNFGLRGAESDRDEAFVRSLGVKYEVEVRVKKFDTGEEALRHKKSIQETARLLRYSWFEKLVQENNFNGTLLAHHANDNVETVLMNFFRGTGLNGLTGMDKEWKHTGNGFRPMLSFTRLQIEAYAREKNLKWVEDSSNDSDKYTRNFLRNQLIPDIQKVYPQVEVNLLQNIERFRKTNILYNLLVEDLKKKLLKKGSGHETRIPVKELIRYADTSLIYEIIKDYGFSEAQVSEVIKLAAAESGKFIANNEYQVIKHRAWLVIAPVNPAGSVHAISDEKEIVVFEGGRLIIKRTGAKHFKPDSSPGTAQLDAKELSFPMLLRRWKAGDYFYPLGMRKKKKLARFFIDLRLPKNQKENIWVLESAGRIIWILGHRIDDRFKVTVKTKSILHLTFEHQ